MGVGMGGERRSKDEGQVGVVVVVVVVETWGSVWLWRCVVVWRRRERMGRAI